MEWATKLRGAPQCLLLGYHPRANVPGEGKMCHLSSQPPLVSKLLDGQVLELVVGEPELLAMALPPPPLATVGPSPTHSYSAVTTFTSS